MAGSAATSDLTGWVRSPFTGGGSTHDRYEKGSGPGVVVVPEIPGITPEELGFAEHLVAAGFTVVVPSPFGTPGRADTPGYTMRVIARMCVASEFRAFALGARRPIADFLRALAADLAGRTPGPGVGVVGMCFTGGFALAAAADDAVLAAVASQPATPFPVSASRRRDPGMSAAELDRIAERAATDAVCAIGLRFSHDRTSPRARFDTIMRTNHLPGSVTSALRRVKQASCLHPFGIYPGAVSAFTGWYCGRLSTSSIAKHFRG